MFWWTPVLATTSSSEKAAVACGEQDIDGRVFEGGMQGSIATPSRMTVLKGGGGGKGASP